MKELTKNVIIILIIIACFSNCSNQKNNKIQTIKIGAILPLTGTLAQMGQVEQNAMLLALKDINKNIVKVKIIFEDGKGNPKDAVNAARKLLDIDNVDIILTSTTGASLAVQPITTEKKKNLIAFCMDPDIAKKSDYVLRFYIGIDEEAIGIMNYFKNNKNDKIGILYAKIPVWEKVVNNTLIPFFKSNKIEINFNDSYQLDEKNFSSYIIKLKNEGITNLILLGYGFEYPNIFKSLSEYKLLNQIQIIGGWGFLYTPVDKKLLEGILVSGPEYVYKNQELAKSFYDKYYKEYNSYPNFDAAFAYNVIISLNQNIKKQDLNQPLKNIFIQKGELSGVLGKYYISKDGNMIVKTDLGKFVNGEIKEVSVK